MGMYEMSIVCVSVVIGIYYVRSIELYLGLALYQYHLTDGLE